MNRYGIDARYPLFAPYPVDE